MKKIAPPCAARAVKVVRFPGAALYGQANDVRLTDLKIGSLRDIARSTKKDGVGYDAQSDFVHLDPLNN